MKNNGGWGLRAELVICLVLTVFFGIAVILIGKVVNRLNDINGNDNNNPVVDDNVIIKENNNNSNSTVEPEEEKEALVENINHSSLEDKLVSAGVKYANKYYKDTDLIVTVVRLQSEDMLEELMINDVQCSGYIEIKKDESFKYYPYIKCGDIYETNGYISTKDNVDL